MKNPSLITPLLILFGIIILCNPTQLCAQTDYQIQKGDRLTITVMEHPEFSVSDVVVLPDGYIQFPGVGRIKAIDHSPLSLSNKVETALTNFVVDPLVTIYVRKIQNQTINIFGYLSKPGQYQIFEPMDILSAISRAGGFPNIKKAKSMHIIRGDGSQQNMKVKTFLKNPACLPPLKPGDTLFIQPRNSFNWSLVSFISTSIYALTNLLRIL